MVKVTRIHQGRERKAQGLGISPDGKDALLCGGATKATERLTGSCGYPLKRGTARWRRDHGSCSTFGRGSRASTEWNSGRPTGTSFATGGGKDLGASIFGPEGKKPRFLAGRRKDPKKLRLRRCDRKTTLHHGGQELVIGGTSRLGRGAEPPRSKGRGFQSPGGRIGSVVLKRGGGSGPLPTRSGPCFIF